MKLIAMFRWATLFVSLCWAVGANSQARQDAEIPNQLVVMTSATFAAALSLLGPQFESETNISLVIVGGASSGGSLTSIPSRLASGEHADVIILSRESLDQLTERGDVRSETRVDLVRSIIGMAVRAGAEMPDISSVDAFVQTMRDAESFGYSASVSGTYLSGEVFPGLGIWEEIGSEGIRVTGEPVGVVVARGEVDIGFQQISEILAVEGVVLVGPLPAELQLESTFSAAVTQRAVNMSTARALIDYLSSEPAAEVIESTGLISVAWEEGR